MAIEIAVVDRRSERAWLDLPYRVFADDPHWIAPLLLQEQRRITRKHNPFFTFGEAEFFIAYRDGVPVGRISAQINPRHHQRYGDKTGHFGFFDCIDDVEAARALVETAKQWLKQRGMQRMVGPLSLSINEEAGMLVDGFDSPAAFLTPHGRPWYGGLLEQAGLKKEIDLYAFRMNPSEVPQSIRRLAKLATQNKDITVRRIKMKDYRAEVSILTEIFNDAWADNWGFVPFSDAEIDALISETRFLLRDDYGRFLFYKGEPVAMMLALPDLNSVIANFRGRLLPFNVVRIAAAFMRARWRSARIPLLGLKQRFRTTPLGTAMLALLISEFLDEARAYPLQWVEFSWVLESNRNMVTLGKLAAGEPAKTYRIFQIPLT